MSKTVKRKVPDCIPEDAPANQDKSPACTWEPIGDRCVVIRDSEDEVTPGGIILPDAAQSKPRYGTVIAAGPGVLRQVPRLRVTKARADAGMVTEDQVYEGDPDRYPMQIKEGDRVVISSYAETVETGAGREVVIIRENEVLAIIR